MRLIRHGSHTSFDLKVHLVWIPKYRKRVLVGPVGEAVRDLVRSICAELKLHIVSGKVAPDHVHLFLSYPPHLAISDIVQRLKGKSSYKLFQLFPGIRKTFWGKHFWARGYFAASSGTITDATIQAYIESQQGEDIRIQDSSV
jgi:putative transposase